MAESIILSKSRLKRGLQCTKSLYFTLHQKHLEPKPGPALQAQFDEGHEVGVLARQQLGRGKGYLIDLKPWDFHGYVRETKAAIERGEDLIFEASVQTGNLFARTDILKRNTSSGKWDIMEVKKSTDVRRDHIDDMTIQYLISGKAGVAIERLYVVHINRDCVFPNLEELFVIRDVTEQVLENVNSMKGRLNELWKMAKVTTEPVNDIGPHCDSPYKCVFKGHCWQKIPAMSVFNIYKIGGKKWEYYNEGIISIDEVNPEDFSGNVKRMIECTRSNTRFIDREGIRSALSEFEFPLYFLDFETAMYAIPRYHGTRPYQQLPFQYSLHVWRAPESSTLEHFEFLHTNDSDPGRQLAEKLLTQIGPVGSLVAYNRKFEMECLNSIGKRFPDLKDKLEDFISRFVDPLPIFQNHVYDPKFKGTFSIKTVAPALLGDQASYEGMEIADGEMAQVTLRNLITGKYSNLGRCTRENLLAYCRKDTQVMVDLVKWLYATQ
ncbi:MAG: hypothetical protein A4S09_13185 [Proteobacteria bacterium SG_bin7]|nr:MAG: hypothetical protein A4S09_13185 [Proteobacteria bacterium SG_bin7]